MKTDTVAKEGERTSMSPVEVRKALTTYETRTI